MRQYLWHSFLCFQYRLLFAHFSQVEPANFTNGTKAEANGQIAGIEGLWKELIIPDIIFKTKKKIDNIKPYHWHLFSCFQISFTFRFFFLKVDESFQQLDQGIQLWKFVQCPLTKNVQDFQNNYMRNKNIFNFKISQFRHCKFFYEIIIFPFTCISQ